MPIKEEIIDLAEEFGLGLYSADIPPYDKAEITWETISPVHFTEYIREEHEIEDLKAILENLKENRETVLARAKSIDETHVELEKRWFRWKEPVPLTEAEIEADYNALVENLGGFIAAAEEIGF